MFPLCIEIYQQRNSTLVRQKLITTDNSCFDYLCSGLNGGAGRSVTKIFRFYFGQKIHAKHWVHRLNESFVMSGSTTNVSLVEYNNKL